jgi:3-phenylpropionate/cinnamic acid dioxygenase small subunit
VLRSTGNRGIGYRRRGHEPEWFALSFTVETEEHPVTNPSTTESIVQIREVVAKLAYLADTCPNEEVEARYMTLFTEDAEWSVSNPAAGSAESRSGSADIYAGVAARRAGGTQGPGSNLRHLVTTVVVQVREDGTALSEAYALIMAKTNTTSPVIVGVGNYTDEFVYSEGNWKVASRTILFH